MKLYLPNLSNSRKKNYFLLFLSVLGFLLLITITNLVGLKVPRFADKTLYWVKNYNPFLLFIALTLFNLFKSIKIKSSLINNISSITLYIYLIHENLLIRNYSRIYLWNQIHQQFTFQWIVLETLIYATGLFIVSCILSFIYKETINKLTSTLTNKIYQNPSLQKKWNHIENKLLKIR